MPSRTNSGHILLIEDDRHIAEGLKLNLVLQGYSVDIALDGPTGLRKWKEQHPDLIVLDIMLPGIGGLSVLQSVRLEDERLPVLILSAKAAPDDIIRGLSFGVDDYLAKPFNLEEFLLRVKRLLRRADWSRKTLPPTQNSPDYYTFGSNRIDFTNKTALGVQGPIRLTEQETKLLKLFVENANQLLARDVLLEVGWGYSRKVNTRTVDTFMVRLRRYFEADPREPRFFKSVRAVGYVFRPQGDTVPTDSDFPAGFDKNPDSE